jgi:hypothetical protein
MCTKNTQVARFSNEGQHRKIKTADFALLQPKLKVTQHTKKVIQLVFYKFSSSPSFFPDLVKKKGQHGVE